MSSINEYRFSEKKDRDKVFDMFSLFFKKRSFVPFFGSGFTKGEIAKLGKVPSVEELKNQLLQIIDECNVLSQNDKNELLSQSLAYLSNFFWEAFDECDLKLRRKFFEYISKNFTDVNINDDSKKSLLECKWRYIYTLNYDDAIERYLKTKEELYTIFPFSKINSSWIDEGLYIYKIHGDAKEYIKTADNKYLILSQNQYLSMIDNEENADLKNKIMTDFISNNIIFFGCSLIDEIDIILSVQNGFAQKKKMNKDTRCVYIKYISDEHQELSYVEKGKLANCGITDVIFVKKEEMSEFYESIKRISDEVTFEQDELEIFSDFYFESLSEEHPDNIRYLFINSFLSSSKKNNLPYFFIRRKITKSIIDDINQNQFSLYIIRGSHFSGKTYILYDLIKEYKNFRTFYFKSGTIISDMWLNELLNRKDIIVFFDENTLTTNQMYFCRAKSNLEKMKKNNVKIILAIDCSIGIFTKHFFEDNPMLINDLQIYFINSQLETNEIQEFNKKIGKLGLSDYNSNDSLLDYVLRIDNQSLYGKYNSYLPQCDILSNNEDATLTQRKKLLKLLIILSNQSSITISEAIRMQIDDIVLKYCQGNDAPFFGVIQKEMLLEEEKSRDIHDNFKIINNSQYWIYKCLFDFAKNPNNYDAISKTYYEIVATLIEQIEATTEKKKKSALHNKIKPYYFLDTIQQTFFRAGYTKTTGSVSLPEKIYEKLMPLLNEQYQFMHQKAKCLLRKSRIYKYGIDSTVQKKKCLNSALQQINRAIDLAQKKNALNVEHTIFHMQVTKVLILVNDWRFCKSEESDAQRLSNVIREYKNMLEPFVYVTSNIYNQELDEQEIKDVKWFIHDLMTNITTKKLLSPQVKKQANEIVNESNKKILMKK